MGRFRYIERGSRVVLGEPLARHPIHRDVADRGRAISPNMRSKPQETRRGGASPSVALAGVKAAGHNDRDVAHDQGDAVLRPVRRRQLLNEWPDLDNGGHKHLGPAAGQDQCRMDEGHDGRDDAC